MQRFQFNLEAALRLRRQLEDQAQVAVAEARRRLAQEQAQAQELQAETRRHQASRAALQRSAVDVRVLLDADNYSSALQRSVMVQDGRVMDAEGALEGALGMLRQRRIDREALERLRQRKLEEHQEEQLRVEQQELDEGTVLRWPRG